MATNKKITDHNAIKQWAAKHNAKPAMATATAEEGDGVGVLRLQRDESADNLEEITWETWFETFDSKNLAVLVDEESGFSKIVSRES